MKITLASAMGTCFGVQDAIDMALDERYRNRLTIVGQLVHNPQTVARLLANGVRIVERDEIDSITTEFVMVTAHGASSADKTALAERFTVLDASCPLVIRLHKLALFLERKGYYPIVIGQKDHVEVRGVVGNLERSSVIANVADVSILKGAGHTRIGIVSQTTNRLENLHPIIAAIQALPEVTDVRFIDTICQPVKDRQQAVVDLLHANIDLGIVIGGKNSSNTKKLQSVISDQGIEVHHITHADDINPAWLLNKTHIGITAGTSTPQDVIEAVYEHIQALCA